MDRRGHSYGHTCAALSWRDRDPLHGIIGYMHPCPHCGDGRHVRVLCADDQPALGCDAPHARPHVHVACTKCGARWIADSNEEGQTYELSMQRDGDVLRAQIAGERTREGIESAARAIMAACAREGIGKVLVDVRAFEGRLLLFDDYRVATEGFRKLQPSRGLVYASAIVDNPENQERYAFFEDAARTHGFNVRVFDHAGRASAWLREQKRQLGS